jgi:hypothetical protein
MKNLPFIALLTATAALVVSLFVLIVWPGTTKLYNWTGQNQEKAQRESAEWVANDPALAHTNPTITCPKHDSDYDGFITCSVPTESGDPITLECPVRKFWAFTENHSCKPTERFAVKSR